MKMFNLKFPGTALLAVTVTSLSIQIATAAPGTIATQPLQTAASAESNVMFVLDSSGSMDIISPEPFTHTFTCDNTNSILDETRDITLDIDSSEPEIRYESDDDSDSRPLGNSGSSDYCFDPAKTYKVKLNTDTGTWSGYWAPYPGDYLNWYFDSTNDGTANWVNYKPTVNTRMQIAQSALNGLIDTLKSVNVGLATFDSNSVGADLDVAIAPIDTTHAATLKTAVTGTTAGGGTPLAETLLDIGRYFANGDGNNSSTLGECGGATNTDLTIHPDDALVADGGLKEDIACTTLLDAQSSAFTDAKGPIEHFCQKNFAVMLTDGFPTSDGVIPADLKDYDQDCPDPADPDTYTCGTEDTKSYDSSTVDYDYWDDVAQALYEIDLRPDLNNQQGNFHKNNLATYTVGFSDQEIKDLRLIKDTATQGGGEGYFAADSSALTQILTDINAAIEGQSGTAAAVTFNSSTLSSQSAVYQALFNTQRWSGQLRSIPLDGVTGTVLTATCTDAVAKAGTLDNCWNAEDMLDAQTSRTILTYNPVSQRGVNFTFDASTMDYSTITSSDTTSDLIPKTIVDDLCASHDIPFPCNASTAADSTQLAANNAFMEDIVEYLRGDRTHEAAATTRDFRLRAHILGDIVNSSPVYVGQPSIGWPATAPFPEPSDPDNTYYTWSHSSIKDRMPVVYVAANDGMLHGFQTSQSDPTATPPSADAGEEVLAFIPSAVAKTVNLSGLHYLANPIYLHEFYVDLNPAVSDVYIKHRDTVTGTVTANEEWRTVLVGGQGAGGNSMYMLDVTDPADFNAANAKELVEWEFTTPNLGYTFSKPIIAMMNNGRFAAIFGNGYNSNEFGGDCKAKLFVVFLDGGVDGTWTAGTDYYEYDTTVGDTTDCNGLSSPAVVDLNHDGVADKVYAGDMLGNMWAFDLCNWDSSNSVCQATSWGLANTSPIMTATNASGQAQPITVKPAVSLDPASTGIDDLLITFGTGQYLATNDITSTEVQSFYAVRHYDAMTNSLVANYGLDPRDSADLFVEQTLTEIACTVDGCTGDVRKISNLGVDSAKNGWFIDFDINDSNGDPVDGERVVVNPKIRNNTLFFNTVKPDDRECYAGGDGWLMSVNLQNGGTPAEPVFDLNNDGLFDNDDQEGGENPAGQKIFAIPAESTFLGDNQYTPDSSGSIQKRTVNILDDDREGRVSWTEILESN